MEFIDLINFASLPCSIEVCVYCVYVICMYVYVCMYVMCVYCVYYRLHCSRYQTVTRLKYNSSPPSLSVLRYAYIVSIIGCICAVCCSVSQCVAVCCSALQCVAEVCVYCEYYRLHLCSMLQCVAVCCSVLQRYAYIVCTIGCIAPTTKQ